MAGFNRIDFCDSHGLLNPYRFNAAERDVLKKEGFTFGSGFLPNKDARQRQWEIAFGRIATSNTSTRSANNSSDAVATNTTIGTPRPTLSSTTLLRLRTLVVQSLRNPVGGRLRPIRDPTF